MNPISRRSAAALLLPLAAACGRDAGAHAGWAGTIDTLADGRVQVTNPEAGAWREGEGWTLVEEVRIGSADEEGPELFGDWLAGVEVDGLGRMWVADVQASEIRVFSAEGRHVRTIGRKGGGPGEFQQIAGMEWAPDGRLWVLDPQNARFSVIDTTGAFVTSHMRKQALSLFPWLGGFDARGNFYDAGGYAASSDQFRQALFRYDSAMTAVDTLPIPEFEGQNFELKSGPNVTRAYVPYSASQQWIPSRAGGIWVGTGERYALHHVTMDGDTTRSIVRQFTPAPVSSKERDEAVERLDWFTKQGGRLDAGRIPSTKPAYAGFFEDEDGYLWVRPELAEADGRPFDVFDPEGRYLGRTALPDGIESLQLHAVRGGRAYGVIRDDDGVSYVVRFRIQNRSAS